MLVRLSVHVLSFMSLVRNLDYPTSFPYYSASVLVVVIVLTWNCFFVLVICAAYEKRTATFILDDMAFLLW